MPFTFECSSRVSLTELKTHLGWSTRALLDMTAFSVKMYVNKSNI